MPISPPVQITVPFATSGLKNPIPANTNNVTGNAGYDAGFGAINMTPKTAGGIPPFGQDFNGIFYDVTLALQFLEAGGSFPYSSTFATAVGGYPIGALVSRTDGFGLWRNTVANNSTNPETFGAGWQPEDAGTTSVAMSNANVTLTALQAARSIITITGVLTANIQLIAPTYQKKWIISNTATGAFSVTFKTAAGSGVDIPTGSQAIVYGDGTNIKRGDSSATETFSGIARFGTPAEQLAGLLANVASNPAGVLALLTLWFPKRTFGANDFIRLPDVASGWILQWGLVTASAVADTPVTFPTPFPNNLRFIIGHVPNNTANTAYIFTSESETNSGFLFNSVTTGGRNAVPTYWFAFGN